MSNAIRVIGDFSGSLPARAQLALTDRMSGIAFELFRQSHFGDAGLTVANDFGVAFHHADGHAAAGGTKRADTWLPDGNAWNEPVFGNESNEVVFRIAAAGEGRAGAGECGELNEMTAIH